MTNLLQINTFSKFEILLHDRHACSHLVVVKAITTLNISTQTQRGSQSRRCSNIIYHCYSH